MRARTGPEGQDDVRELLIASHLVGGRAGNIEDLAAQRQDRLGFTVARLLCGAPGTVAFDEENLGACGAVAGAIGELARQPQLAGCGLASQLALLPPPLALLGPLRDALQEHPRGRRVGAEPMIEMVLDRVLDEPRRFCGGQPFFGLALKLRIADEQRQQHRGAGCDVLARCLRNAPIADELAISSDPAQESAAQPHLMGAAFGSRNRVAIGMAEPLFLVLGPGDGPFNTAAFWKIDLADEGPRGQQHSPVEARGEVIAESAREVQPCLDRHPFWTWHCGIAAPTDLEATEEISLGARHTVERRRPESEVAKDLGIRMKA